MYRSTAVATLSISATIPVDRITYERAIVMRARCLSN